MKYDRKYRVRIIKKERRTATKMMSTGVHVMLYEPPMMSPEHSSMPTMNTAEMFDHIWCSSDSGVSGDQSPTHPTSPTSDDQILWDPGDNHVLEANLFNTNINHAFEDELDLFCFANELGSEEEIEQLNFPDNISDISSSSSTITSHSIPSSPEHFTDYESTPTTSVNSSFINPGSALTSENISALCDNLKEVQRGTFSKKNINVNQNSPRKRTSKESLDRGQLSKCSTKFPSSKGFEDDHDQNSDGLKGSFAFSPTKKSISNILDSNIKWSDLGSSDQWCLADGLDSIISQSFGIREQLDVKAIIKPHHNSSSSSSSNNQDVHANNVMLLDDAKLDAVRRYLKSLENNSHTKSYPRAKNKTEKKPRKKYSKKNLSEISPADNLLKSNPVNQKERSKNKSSSKIRKVKGSNSHNQSENLKENMIANSLNTETPKFNKETLAEKNQTQISESKLTNRKVNMTESQPSISWQQRKRLNKQQGSHAEQPQKQRNSPSKQKETHTGEPQKHSKKKMDTKPETATKKSVKCKNNKQVVREELHTLKTRFRKEYRQLMKEKRSGLFHQEEVVSLSTVTSDSVGGVQLNLSESDSDDVDILG